jgi:hypothetical protein
MNQLILPIVLLLLTASCTSTTETTYSDAQVDSLSRVKLDSVNIMLRKRNDSLIGVAAQNEAKKLDSLDKSKAPPVKITPVIFEKLPKREYDKEREEKQAVEKNKKDTSR